MTILTKSLILFYVCSMVGKNSSGLFFIPIVTKNNIKQIVTEYFRSCKKP